jgi:hypothetical protein
MSDNAKKFMAQGYAFPCACCAKLWRAMARGMETCEAVFGNQDCGGPVSGMSYPLYEGPLSESALATYCCFCGERAAEAVTSVCQPTRFVGICSRHAPTIDRLVVATELSRRRVSNG